MTSPTIDLRANLNSEDDDGLNWGLLRNAANIGDIVEGAIVIAGTERFWSWVRIRRVDDDGQVRFEQITAEEAGRLVSKKV